MNTRLLVPEVRSDAPPWPHGLLRRFGIAARHCFDSPLGLLAPLLALPLLLLV